MNPASQTPPDAAAVVIGTGAFGVSAAYHLARLGLRRVVAVDRFALASQASPRAAGLFKTIQADQMRTRLAALSIDKMLRFRDETGVDLPVVKSGSLMLGIDEGYAHMVELEYERSLAWGARVELISAEESSRITPFLHAPGSAIICYSPGDIYIEEPSLLLDAYVQAGRQLGATYVPDTLVTGVRVQGGEVKAVLIGDDEIRTPIVVDAAGAWTRTVASTAGSQVAVQPVRHQLRITEPIRGIGTTASIVRVVDNAVYVRPCRRGLMLGGFESNPLPLDVEAQPPSFSTDDVPLDGAVLDRLSDAVRAYVPDVVDAPTAELRGGLFTMTPDGNFLAGPVPPIHGLWALSGCNGSGFSFSPALGQMIAEWIVLGKPSLDISSLSPGRFKPPLDNDYLCRAGVWQYAHYYEPLHFESPIPSSA